MFMMVFCGLHEGRCSGQLVQLITATSVQRLMQFWISNVYTLETL